MLRARALRRAPLLPEVGPQKGDVSFVKKKPSAFFGTPLLAYLVDRKIDTLIVVGGATSNCVRASSNGIGRGFPGWRPVNAPGSNY